MRRLLILGFVLISFSSSAQTWTPDSYTTFDESSFYKIESLHSAIDFDQVNFPLLQAAIFFVTNEERKKAQLSPFEFRSEI